MLFLDENFFSLQNVFCPVMQRTHLSYRTSTPVAARFDSKENTLRIYTYRMHVPFKHTYRILCKAYIQHTLCCKVSMMYWGICMDSKCIASTIIRPRASSMYQYPRICIASALEVRSPCLPTRFQLMYVTKIVSKVGTSENRNRASSFELWKWLRNQVGI